MKTLLLTLLLLQAPALPAVSSAKGVIRGSVVAADTGQPVAGVYVVARYPASGPSVVEPVGVTTGEQGQFELAALSPGDYAIVVDGVAAQGFARQAYGSPQPGLQGMGAATPISVAAGQTVQGIVIRLVRGGTISGRILGIQGAPFVDAEVRLNRIVFDASGRRFLGELPIQVNDRGEYRFFGVDPGPVYLSAGPQTRLIVLTPGGEASRYAESTVYPRAADFASASTIDVKPGGELTNVDIQLLPRPPTFSVRGRVIDSGTGQTLTSGVQFSLVPRQGERTHLRGYIPKFAPEGSFELNDVAEGEYWIAAQLPPRPVPPRPGEEFSLQPSPLAVQRIEVRNADVAGLVLTLTPPALVSGRVSIEGEPVETLANSIRVQLDVIRSGSFPMNMGIFPQPAKVFGDGTFTIADVQAGEYRVKVLGLPSDVYLKQALLDAADALNEGVTIGANTPGRLDVVLTRGGGQIAGQLVNAEQREIANAQVVLIPDKLRGRVDLYKVATSDATGRFAFRGILPGDYKVFAWAHSDSFQYFDRDFVRVHEAQGEPVHVEEGASQSLVIRQIP